MGTGNSTGVQLPCVMYTVSSEEIGTREGGLQITIGELPGHLVVILWSALLGGVLLLLGSIIGTPPSQTGMMLLAPPYQIV